MFTLSIPKGAATLNTMDACPARIRSFVCNEIDTMIKMSRKEGAKSRYAHPYLVLMGANNTEARMHLDLFTDDPQAKKVYAEYHEVIPRIFQLFSANENIEYIGTVVLSMAVTELNDRQRDTVKQIGSSCNIPLGKLLDQLEQQTDAIINTLGLKAYRCATFDFCSRKRHYVHHQMFDWADEAAIPGEEGLVERNAVTYSLALKKERVFAPLHVTGRFDTNFISTHGAEE